MSTQIFQIAPYKSFNKPVVEYEKKIYNNNGNNIDKFKRGYNSFSIDIHEIEEGEPIRKKNPFIDIELTPDWCDKKNIHESIQEKINDGENPEDVISLSIRLICPKIKYVIQSINIPIDHIQEIKNHIQEIDKKKNIQK